MFAVLGPLPLDQLPKRSLSPPVEFSACAPAIGRYAVIVRRYRVNASQPTVIPRPCGRYGAAARIWAASGAADVAGEWPSSSTAMATSPRYPTNQLAQTGCLPLFTATVPTWP